MCAKRVRVARFDRDVGASAACHSISQASVAVKGWHVEFQDNAAAGV